MPVDQHDLSTWHLTTALSEERVLRLDLSDLSGWMANNPAGHHVIVVSH